MFYLMYLSLVQMNKVSQLDKLNSDLSKQAYFFKFSVVF